MAWVVRFADEFEPEFMGKTLNEKLASLPANRRNRIEREATELISEELSLRELRKALELTQNTLAEKLEVGQDTISRLERRTDMLLSTLQDYVAALGGELELQVRFPGHKKVRLKSLHQIDKRDRVA